MIRLRKELLLIALIALSGCVSPSAVKGHLSSGEVEALMVQGVISKFEVSRSGSAIVLDNGDVLTAELPATGKIDEYLEGRRKLGKPGIYEIE